MSWLFAAIYDPFMRESEEACLAGWRAELLADAAGDVLEIGAGTGANVAFYPPGVARLVLTEPDASMRARLARRLPAARAKSVETVAAPVSALPFDARSFDVVVSTLVLCSVPDVARALGEVRRVLRPGGRFVFLEHVAAEGDPARLAWQRRIEPFWKLVSGNCHLTRTTGDAIRAAGFTVEKETRDSMRKALPFVRPSIRGVAR
jgi:ubiquinone/menaquinone biosynthesis C-methylase UbiE